MENVLYSKKIQHPAEEMGSEHADLYLTQEANGFAIFLKVDGSLHLLHFYVTNQRDFAVEMAVRYAKRPLEELLREANQIYP